jgi:hypothetical protein
MYRITSLHQIRSAFWRAHPDLSRRRVGAGVDADYPTDTRVAFVDFVDYLVRSGDISENLAHRATLQ